MSETQVSRSSIYVGQVMHKRLRPFAHRFAYRVFSVYLDLDELDALAQRVRIFSHNRFNLFSFHDKDHGRRDGSSLREWAEGELSAAGVADASQAIRLLCFPRILGYAFNPLSVWYCYGPGDHLRAVIYEVRNTFGQKHSYVIPVAAARQAGGPIVQSSAKRLYVSPFIGMGSHYRFRLREPGERLSILIRQWVEGEELLIATQTGRREAFCEATLWRGFLSIPLMTVKVIAAIHWQALKLWFKGAKIVPRPGRAGRPAESPTAWRPNDQEMMR